MSDRVPNVFMNMDTVCEILRINEVRLAALVREGALPRIRPIDGYSGWMSAELLESRFVKNPAEFAPPPPVYTPDRVYFVEMLGLIKIGFTGAMKHRLRQLQDASPFDVKLICHINGSYDLEAKLHATFSGLRVRGEWFRKEPPLLDYIENLKTDPLTKTAT